MLRTHPWTHYLSTGLDNLPCSHGTYQHEAITSRSHQLLMLGTWLPETCWATIRINNKKYKKWHLFGFSYPHCYIFVNIWNILRYIILLLQKGMASVKKYSNLLFSAQRKTAIYPHCYIFVNIWNILHYIILLLHKGMASVKKIVICCLVLREKLRFIHTVKYLWIYEIYYVI